MHQKLIEKIAKKEAVVGIVGLGYVGLPLAIAYVANGFRVIGFDIDVEKVQKLEKGESYIKHIGIEAVAGLKMSQRFSATADFKQIQGVDAIILCVPTPLDDHQAPDLSFVLDTVESCVPFIRPGQIMSLESTTYPGTTKEELLPRIKAKGLHVGEDYFLVFSPEREDPGNAHFKTHEIPKVVGGVSPRCKEVGVALYGSVFSKVVPVRSAETAEMTKLLENIYRAVNIGLVNEIKIVCDKMGIDVWEVIEAAKTKPFGFTPFYPGPGLGGHCIPIDPFYLTWKAKEFGVSTRFIELAGEVNTSMPQWVVGKVSDALNERQKSVKGSKILVLGVAYKKNVDDARESPSVELMELLQEKGAIISYSDTFFPNFPKMREHSFDLSSVSLTPETLKSFDCVLISTDHDTFDYKMLLEHAPLIVDTRGRYREPNPKVVRA